MIKLKKKKGEKLITGADSGVRTPEGAATTKRDRTCTECISAGNQVLKKSKLSSSSSISSFSSSSSSKSNKEAPSSTTSSSPSTKLVLNGVPLDCAGLDRAIRALCRHIQKKKEENDIQDLLDEDGGPMVCLMFSLQNIPTSQRIYPHLIELPYSPQTSTGEVCLIVQDPQRKWKDLVSSHRSSLSFISRVISYKKLPKKYPQFADKRNLCSSYDLFIVDNAIKEKVYHNLGKVFYSANKLPLPVRIRPSTLEREVKKAYKSTALVIRRGASVAVRIGRSMAPPEHLIANAVAVIEGVSEFFKQNHKWKNIITTIHVQATNTPALPVYIHPKYTQAADYYANNKPPTSEKTEEGEEKQEKKKKENKKQTTETIKVIHKVKDTRKIKRGGESNAKPKNKLSKKQTNNAAEKEKKIKHKTHKNK